jgi:hypothetical protein
VVVVVVVVVVASSSVRREAGTMVQKTHGLAGCVLAVDGAHPSTSQRRGPKRHRLREALSSALYLASLYSLYHRRVLLRHEQLPWYLWPWLGSRVPQCTSLPVNNKLIIICAQDSSTSTCFRRLVPHTRSAAVSCTCVCASRQRSVVPVLVGVHIVKITSSWAASVGSLL